NVEVLNPERLARPAICHEAASVTLDQFCSERNITPDVIKIDVEGAEVRVLLGAGNVLARSRPVLLCEIHPQQMANCGSSLTELESFREHHGYTITRLDEPNTTGIFHALLEKQA